jgi:L-arabinokinase
MGGIADYSGSLVLELPLEEAAVVTLERTGTRTLAIESSHRRRFEMPVDDFLERGEPRSYESARLYFRRAPWAAYVAGAFLVLMREKGVQFREGARLVLRSSVPEGKGVASSAAIEVATMTAIDALYDVGLDPIEVAFLSQKVENLVVGAPCGVMDQMTAVFGEENHLLALRCQPASIVGTVPIPEGLGFWGIDSGVTHAISGADYGSVRIGAFMGYRLVRELGGNDFGGYLANVSPEDLERAYLPHLPETMTGGEFLERFGTWEDSATRIDPAATYPVRQSTVHPIYENDRVETFRRLLSSDALALGELMFRSHESYSACGLGSDATDRLVELARAAGPARGIYGAKITGGGSGGTVAILGRSDAEETVREMAERYRSETGRASFVFSGSSPGARASGRKSGGG